MLFLGLVLRNVPKSLKSKQELRSKLLSVCLESTQLRSVLISTLKDHSSTEGDKLSEKRLRHHANRMIRWIVICTDKNKNSTQHAKGYCFITFARHELAVAFLHYLNNNYSLFQNTEKRLIAEFALEDKRAIRVQNLRHKKNILNTKRHT